MRKHEIGRLEILVCGAWTSTRTPCPAAASTAPRSRSLAGLPAPTQQQRQRDQHFYQPVSLRGLLEPVARKAGAAVSRGSGAATRRSYPIRCPLCHVPRSIEDRVPDRLTDPHLESFPDQGRVKSHY
jgi:hypothetical protein